MNKHDYVAKVENLLSDLNTYKGVGRDPTAKLQRMSNELIKVIKSRQEISEEIAKQLTVYNSVSSKLYCLPKIHKSNIPLRPIVSCIGSTFYNLSKYLSKILTESLAERTNYNIRDTFSFVRSIQGLVLPDNYVLLSLDVVSLFTNIPSQFALELLQSQWHKIEPHSTLSRGSFFELLSVVWNNCYFSFNNKFYQQIFGTPMGSPISPILAQIVMDHILDTIVSKLPFNVPLLYKFVDDIVSAVPASEIETTLQIFNSVNKHIQFTMETETNNSIPFLDTLVVRTDDGRVILNWYQKPTSSGRYINFFSNHPTNQKFNTVIAMKNRVAYISDQSFLKQNLDKLYKLFLNNGYPSNTLRKLIYQSGYIDGPIEEQDNSNVKYKRLPFIQGLTNNIVRYFNQLDNIRIAKYNAVTVGNLFTNTKDKTPLLQACNVIYKIPCSQCDGCYIGQTGQNLKNRITQHKSDSRTGKKSCALAIHFQNMDHNFDFEKTAILERERNYKKRLFLEMVHINKVKGAINSKSDIDQLSAIYCNILE